MNELIKRLKNPTSVIAIVGTIGLLLVQFGVKVDLEWLDSTIKLLCSLLVAIGVIGNPTEPGLK